MGNGDYFWNGLIVLILVMGALIIVAIVFNDTGNPPPFRPNDICALDQGVATVQTSGSAIISVVCRDGLYVEAP